jgi:hypothetical protein
MSAPHPRARKRKLLPRPGHEFGLWRREVSWEGGLSHESQQSPVASPPAACPPTECPPVAASHRLPTFAFVMGSDGRPELVIRGEHPWLVSSRQAMPMLPRRRHEIGQPAQEVTRREFDDAVGTRACGLPPAPRADPVGRLVSGEHVADAGEGKNAIRRWSDDGACSPLPPPGGETRGGGDAECSQGHARWLRHDWPSGNRPSSPLHSSDSIVTSEAFAGELQ